MMGDSIEETRRHHVGYLRAISRPLRRQILRAVKAGCTTIEGFRGRTKLDESSLNWHLDILDRGFCVEKQIEEGKPLYRLTQEGEIVDFLE